MTAEVFSPQSESEMITSCERLIKQTLDVLRFVPTQDDVIEKAYIFSLIESLAIIKVLEQPELFAAFNHDVSKVQQSVRSQLLDFEVVYSFKGITEWYQSKGKPLTEFSKALIHLYTKTAEGMTFTIKEHESGIVKQGVWLGLNSNPVLLHELDHVVGKMVGIEPSRKNENQPARLHIRGLISLALLGTNSLLAGGLAFLRLSSPELVRQHLDQMDRMISVLPVTGGALAMSLALYISSLWGYYRMDHEKSARKAAKRFNDQAE